MQQVDGNQLAEGPATHRAAFWLGMLNTVDGWLQVRADRPAHTMDQLHRWFHQWRDKHPSEPIDRLMEQWQRIEQFYQASGPAESE